MAILEPATGQRPLHGNIPFRSSADLPVKFSMDFSLGSTTGLQIPASGMLYKKLVEINYLEYHILPLFVREAPHPCVFPFDWWQNLIFMDSPPSANLPTIWDWILDYASRELHATPAFELKYTSIVIRAERPPWGCNWFLNIAAGWGCLFFCTMLSMNGTSIIDTIMYFGGKLKCKWIIHCFSG